MHGGHNIHIIDLQHTYIGTQHAFEPTINIYTSLQHKYRHKKIYLDLKNSYELTSRHFSTQHAYQPITYI